MSMIRQAIGIDPGARWTGVVLRHGEHVVTGATIGPRNRDGQVEAKRLDNVFHAAPDKFVFGVRHLAADVAGVVDELVELGRRETGVEPAIGIERYEYRPSARAGTSWLVPLLLVQALMCRFPAARFVPPGEVGDTSEYPPALRGKHPNGWLRRDHPQNRREHEQSAWNVAEAVLKSAGGAR